MMTREDRQEALSLAYIEAVAAVCGMTFSRRSKDYGIDITLHDVQRRGARYFETGACLDIQVKSTTAVVESRTTIGYDLPVKAYEDLRFESERDRILAVFAIPPDEADWLRQTRTKLEMRHCVYWASLRGAPAVRNRSSVRLAIPKRQRFTGSSLSWIMERIRAEERLS